MDVTKGHDRDLHCLLFVEGRPVAGTWAKDIDIKGGIWFLDSGAIFFGRTGTTVEVTTAAARDREYPLFLQEQLRRKGILGR